MAVIHSKQEILEHLTRMTTGILATLDADGNVIRLRVMYYGFDDEFNFYFMSTKESPKIDQMMATAGISFMVFCVEDPYDESWELEINGTAMSLFVEEEIFFALNKLKGINPFADVALESGEIGIFSFIKLSPSIVKFRNYGEGLKGEPPTVLEF